MRIMAAGLGALFAIAAITASNAAEAKSPKRHAKKSTQGHAHATPRQDHGYVQQLADKMRFGSSAWWDQMRREGRLGGETP